MDPKISVIVPIYNVEPYLAKCINSILEQSFSRFELLLINDGSTDDSEKLCKIYKTQDSRVKYFYKKNGGLSDARNFGLDKANCEYIVFVDSDDYLEKDYLKDLYNNIRKYKTDISISGFNLVTESGQKIRSYNLNKADNDRILTGQQLIKATFRGKDTLPNIVTWNKIYKSSLFKDIKFEKGRYYEDEYIFIPLFWNIKKVGFVYKNLYNYVERPGSITSSPLTVKKIKDIRDLYAQRFNFLKFKNLNLYYICVDMYKSWIVEIMSKNAKDLSPDIKSILQQDFRTYKSKKIKLRNLLGYIDIRLAGKVKQILVRHR